MRPLGIADSATIILGLQDEIRRSEESRYDHRLHGVLLVAQGMTSPEAARLLGDAPRTVEYWVHTFEEMGLAGLLEGEGAVWAAATPERQADSGGQRGLAWDAPGGRPRWKSVGRQDAGALDRTAVWHRFRGTAVPTTVPTIGIPDAQTAAGDRSGGPRTTEGA